MNELNTLDMDYRKGVVALESEMHKVPGALVGDAWPLKHTFADGAYIREIFLPKGTVFITKIHKITHPYFIMKGDVSVWTEAGVVRLTGPLHGITKAGTKRVIYTHEDTVWITVHVTKETDLEKIEEEVIAKTFDDLPNDVIDVEVIREFVTKLEEGSSATSAS